jgi:hypothetical protein
LGAGAAISQRSKGGTAVKEAVSVARAEIAQEAVLAAGVQEALGELVGAAREGLLALGVGVGLGVVAELMEEEVTGIVGPKGKHDATRIAVRHCHETGEVTLGVVAWRWSARACAAPTATRTCRLRPTHTSPIAID